MENDADSEIMCKIQRKCHRWVLGKWIIIITRQPSAMSQEIREGNPTCGKLNRWIIFMAEKTKTKNISEQVHSDFVDSMM